MSRIPEAAVTINGKRLSHEQAGVLRVALQFARRDFEAAPNDFLAVKMLGGVDDMLKLIDETEVEL